MRARVTLSSTSVAAAAPRALSGGPALPLFEERVRWASHSAAQTR